MYSFLASFWPVSRTFAAFTTTTKSPASTCGENTGLFFPRSTEATRDASRPRTTPSASATYQRRAARAASALRFFVVRVIDIVIGSIGKQRRDPRTTVAAGVPPQMAGPTRLELATSCVTGRRSNQLNYDPVTPEARHRVLLAERSPSCNRRVATRRARPARRAETG